MFECIFRDPSTESDYLKQAISTNFSQKNNIARQNQNTDGTKKGNNFQKDGNSTISSPLPKIDRQTFVAPSSPGQIRLAKESAAVKSLTLSRLQDKVKHFETSTNNDNVYYWFQYPNTNNFLQ